MPGQRSGSLLDFGTSANVPKTAGAVALVDANGDAIVSPTSSQLPASLGQKADAASLSVVLSSGQVDGNGLNVDITRLPQFSYRAVAVADVQVKGSAGFLHTVTISCNDAAPTAGSIIVYDSLTETGTQVFNHTFTTTPFVPFTVTLDYVMATGIFIGFTTTGDVNVSCSYL